MSGLKLYKTVEYAADTALLTTREEIMRHELDARNIQIQTHIQSLFLICRNASKVSSNLYSDPDPKPVLIC